ncbi:MAG: hypothetical protein GQ529_05805 [Methyloprofundus sp.]|nr:hypothetical protein [Methyloprofundus sp.]
MKFGTRLRNGTLNLLQISLADFRYGDSTSECNSTTHS